MRILVTLAVLLSTSVAAAQAPGLTRISDPEDPPVGMAPMAATRVEEAVQLERVDYRNQIMLSDGLSVAAVLSGAMMGNEAGGQLALLGVSGYLVGAPLVHLAHGRGGAAVKSFGLRTALPMLGMVAGFKLGPNDLTCVESGAPSPEQPSHSHGGCTGSITGMIGGLVIGTISASILDAKYLSNYEVARRVPTWTANVGHVRGGMTVAISGSF